MADLAAEFEAQQTAPSPTEKPSASTTRPASPTAPSTTTEPSITTIGRGSGNSKPLDLVSQFEQQLPKTAPLKKPVERYPAATPASNALQPFTELIPDYRAIASRHGKEAGEALKEMWTAPGLGWKAWGAMKFVGDTGMYIASPIEALFKSFAGDPTERATGLKGLGSYGAELGSATAQMFVDPFRPVSSLREIAAPGMKAAGLAGAESTPIGEAAAKWSSKRIVDSAGRLRVMGDPPKRTIGQRIQEVVSPTSVGPEAKRAEQLIRAIYTGPLARAEAQARTTLEEFRRTMAFAPAADRYNFRRAAEGDPSAVALSPDLQKAADGWRALQQKWEGRLRSSGILKGAVDHYYPHIYKFLDPMGRELPSEMQGMLWQQMTNRPLRGSKRAAGLMKREHPLLSDTLTETRPDGTPFGYVRDADGHITGQVELRFPNPIDEQLYRLGGMQRYYYGTELAKEMQKTGMLKWVPGLGHGPMGAMKLDDGVFQRWLPPVGRVSASGEIPVTHFEAFDPKIRGNLKALINHLGFTRKSPIGPKDDPMLPEAYGYMNPANKTVVARHGSDDIVLMHEVGHAIDKQYGLTPPFGGAKSIFQRGTAEWSELEQLGSLRNPRLPVPGTPAWRALPANLKEHITYLRGGVGGRDYSSELVANFFHAYWHAPELLSSKAPLALAKMNQFLAQNPSLKQAIDYVKPGVEIASRETTTAERWEYISKYYPGARKLGEWWAPEPMARVFNNFVSASKLARDPGSIVDGIRKSGNALNMLQLGFSGFHFAFTSYDTLVSRLALAASEAVRGQYGSAAHNAIASFNLPGTAYGTYKRGKELHAAWKKFDESSLNPELAQLVKLYESGGGRMSMDRIYASSGAGSFWKSIRGGYFAKDLEETYRGGQAAVDESAQGLTPMSHGKSPAAGVFRIVGRTLDTSMDWLMGHWVPNVKAGVWRAMAESWLEHQQSLPVVKRATGQETVAEMIKIMDSVDNRMGQMVYDNLFWSKTLKDSAFLAVRAVGWNLGTARELGGGAVDAIEAARNLRNVNAKDLPELTYRMAYSAALPVHTAIIGAVLTYMFTGHGPREWKDYFFPPTGKLDEHGKVARVSQPNYMKDVFSFNEAPVQTALNKLHPLWETASEVYRNRDYFGGIIADPKKSTEQEMLGVLRYFGEQALPFSLRGARKQQQEHASWLPQLMSFFGFVPASQAIVNPERTQRFEDISNRRARRKAEQERR